MKRTAKGEALCSNAGMGDRKELGWAKAVPLQPVLQQQTQLQGVSEGAEKRPRESSRHFLPLVPDVGHLSSEFSHILNSSLLSQQGFQQLDPQVDTTVAGAGARGARRPSLAEAPRGGLNFHPENLAEHPFADERDGSSPELAGNESELAQPSTGESGAQGPQPDLNYYMRLSYHERSTALWDPAQPSVSTIRIQPPSTAAVHKTKVVLPKSGPVCFSLEPGPPRRRAGSSGPGHEKTHAPGKTGKKLSGSLASHSRSSSSSSRGGTVWR
ncbi:hypothetical protein Chor_013624 [Crotalus horridus]